MNNATKLMRSVFLALAIVLAAPLTGLGGTYFGAGPALAQVPSGERLIASVLFEGNQRFTDSNLLAMVEVANRGTLTQDRLNRDVVSIQTAYQQAGYRNVRVTPRVEPTEGGRVRVVFVIDEGQKTGIAAINFTGNASIGAGALKGTIQLHETNLLSWLVKDDNYSDDAAAADAERIRLYYANHGFPDAQVSYVAEFDPSRNGYFVNFTIVEGERYTFGNVGIETSIPGLNANALSSTIGTRQGQRYSYRDLQQTADDMAIEATAQGYPFADVRPRIDRDIVNHIFNVTYLVDEGPRVYVERIDITGNDKTRDFVIRRELDFAEGDPFNRAMVVRGKTNIEKLGYFSQVRVDVQPGSAPDKVVISIDVVEQSTGDYGLTAGYSTSDGVLGEISLTERNFLGRGQYLRIALGASQTGRTFDLSFTEPRFMGLKVSSGIDVYSHINDESATSFYGTTTTGGQLRFGLPITRDLTASVFGGYENKLITDADAPFSGVVTDGQTFNKVWGGYTLTYSTLDDQKHPTEGLIASATQQYVGWDFNYIKSDVRARYFLPLMDDAGIVASVKGQAGIINDLSGAGIHPVEALYHGPSLVRGFEARGIGPRLAGTGEAIGTTWYAGLSAELQAPVPFLPESYGLALAVWADAAYVGGAGAAGPIDPLSTDNPLKASVGASIIWDGPFGPLRGDFAYVLSKATNDRTQVFQLTLQTLL